MMALVKEFEQLNQVGLTDEERELCCNFEEVAEAQLKKVVDYLEHNNEATYEGMLKVYPNEWQSLLDEVKGA